MLETAPFLFEDFSNKDKIMQRIKDLPITRNTVKARILKLAENITNQQFADSPYEKKNIVEYQV